MQHRGKMLHNQSPLSSIVTSTAKAPTTYDDAMLNPAILLTSIYEEPVEEKEAVMTTDERLDSLISSLAGLTAQYQEIFRLVKDHQTTIFGNGDGFKGLKTRLVILEESVNNRRWWERVVWVAIVSAIVGLFFK